MRRIVATATALLGAVALCWSAPVLAHHVPGHAASEGVRNLNTLGGRTGQAGTRLMLLTELGRTTRSLNPATTSITSLLGEYAPHPWFSFGAQIPMMVVDEDAPGVAPKVGYGDTRVFARLTPYADKLVHRVLTYGLAASFPTRTLRFQADPGRIWSVAPSVVFTRTYLRPYWQLIALATVEHRPAGTAVDLSGGARAGYRIHGKLTPSIGVLVDVRVANFCARVRGGAEFCQGSRNTEIERDVGTARVAHLTSLDYTFAPWATLSLNLQLPISPRRDFDVAGSLNLQFQF